MIPVAESRSSSASRLRASASSVSSSPQVVVDSLAALPLLFQPGTDWSYSSGFDVAGRVIMPGLVDTHSHIGGGDGGDRTSALHPAVRIMDSVNARDPGIRKAQSGGITTVNVMPGSGHLMSGQTVFLKLRANPRTIYDLLTCEDYRTDVCGGMKMANGTNPIGTGFSRRRRRDRPPSITTPPIRRSATWRRFTKRPGTPVSGRVRCVD